MFQHFKNIETAFKHVRLFTFVLIGACMATCCYTVYESYQMVMRAQNSIYLLSNGKALQAMLSERKDNIPVEAKDHIKMFHHFFFSLDPDDKVIDANMQQALYLADGTARKQYDDLKESGYYSGIISGNISQQISPDSISVDLSSYPYSFRYYGRQKIIRPTAIVERSLVSEGFLRNVGRSDNNSHGFLIEKWRIIDNKDISVQNR
jgi:conjugative transposon TraK protein